MCTRGQDPITLSERSLLLYTTPVSVGYGGLFEVPSQTGPISRQGEEGTGWRSLDTVYVLLLSSKRDEDLEERLDIVFVGF